MGTDDLHLFRTSILIRSYYKMKTKIFLYLPSAVFIAQWLVRQSKQLKQIIQIEHNIVKNPNWTEANQLAIYKRGRGFELGTTERRIQEVVIAGPEPETSRFQVWPSNNSATLPNLPLFCS